MKYTDIPSKATDYLLRLSAATSSPLPQENHQNILILQRPDPRLVLELLQNIDQEAKDLSGWKFNLCVAAEYTSKIIFVVGCIGLIYVIITQDEDKTPDQNTADQQIIINILSVVTTVMGAGGNMTFSNWNKNTANAVSNLETLHATTILLSKGGLSAEALLLKDPKQAWYKRFYTGCISCLKGRNLNQDDKNELGQKISELDDVNSLNEEPPLPIDQSADHL